MQRDPWHYPGPNPSMTLGSGSIGSIYSLLQNLPIPECCLISNNSVTAFCVFRRLFYCVAQLLPYHDLLQLPFLSHWSGACSSSQGGACIVYALKIMLIVWMDSQVEMQKTPRATSIPQSQRNGLNVPLASKPPSGTPSVVERLRNNHSKLAGQDQ